MPRPGHSPARRAWDLQPVNPTQKIIHIRGTRTQLQVALTVGLAVSVSALLLAMILWPIH